MGNACASQDTGSDVVFWTMPGSAGKTLTRLKIVDGQLKLPDSWRSIPASAFRDCAALKIITLPESLSEIDSSAFRNCRSLTNIAIPIKCRRIGAKAFRGCKALRSVGLPNKLVGIGDFAFSGCDALESVTLPALVQLGVGVFPTSTQVMRVTQKASERPSATSGRSSQDDEARGHSIGGRDQHSRGGSPQGQRSSSHRSSHAARAAEAAKRQRAAWAAAAQDGSYNGGQTPDGSYNGGGHNDRGARPDLSMVRISF